MRRGLWPVAAALALAMVSACGSSQGSPGGDDSGSGPEPVSVAVTHPTNIYILPWLGGMDQGFFEKNGVRIDEIIPGKGGSTTLRNVLQGGLAVGDVSYPAAVEGYVSGGAKVDIVGGATQTPYNVQFYALASNESVNSLKDVDTWAYTNPGSVTQAMTYLIPQVAGVAGQKIERVAAGGIGEGIALLEAGEADITTVPPTVYQETPDKYKLIVDTTEYLPKFQQTVIVASPAYAQDHPDVITGILAGYQQGAEWVTAHPEEAGKLFAEKADTSVEVAQRVVQGAVAVDAWGVGFNAEAIKAGTDGLKATDFEGAVPYCELFTSEYLPEGTESSLPGGQCG
jgi:NitT/TauT family transport system substrate-binding protein